tara:strand:+ start:157 stop:2034 length:1878 start_codon:yes stop_codon:yes gene_type:complete
MQQYIVWFMIWILVVFRPQRLENEKFGIIDVKHHSGDGRSKRYLAIKGWILLSVNGTLLFAGIFFSWALLQDFTFAGYTGSILGFLSQTLPFLALSALLRVGDYHYITGDNPTQETPKLELFVFIGWKPLVAIGIIGLLFTSSVTPLMGNLDENPMFANLNKTSDNTDAPSSYLNDSNEVRVISWNLATQYLERSYGDSASSLATGEWEMMDYTSPTIINGEFVWINAPKFESYKWFGGKEVPFFVTVTNDPANMSSDGFDPVQSWGDGYSVHESQISWANRIDQILFDLYALDMVKVQVRFDVDDDHNPFWVVYLGKRGVFEDVVTMERIVIINAKDINDYVDYPVESSEIPDWLEVVYPDSYVNDWAALWGEWREGILYHMFTKTHLSYPSDTPRFVVLDGESYWYVPMNQLSSNVLAGYILVDTRSGEAVYHNRETQSLANLDTAWSQVDAYLRSGAEGFSQLRIDEGYLYPIMTDSGEVRDAYIFPLYSGFSIQKFAIIDAEEYTQIPVLENELDAALTKYKGTNWDGEVENMTFEWIEWTIENGYCDSTECVLSANGSTYVVESSDLSNGIIDDSENEWRELKLAISEFERTGTATLFVTLSSNYVTDIDFEQSDLVTRA